MADVKATPPKETPLEMYARLRPSMTPKAELFESAQCHYKSALGRVYTINTVVLEWPDKPNTQQDTGQFQLLGEGYAYQAPAGMDTIIDAHYEGSRLIVSAWAGRIVANQWERNSDGTIKQHPFHLSIGTDGILISGELDLGLLQWLGDGYQYLEIPSGHAVKMVAVTPTVTPTA